MKSKLSPSTRRLKQVLTPLGKSEERRAITAALEFYRSQSDQASGRIRVLGAELRINKPSARNALPRREVGVVIVDYDRRQTLELILNSRGQVQRCNPLSYQPTVHKDEIREARQIAENDPAAAVLVRQRGISVDVFAPGQVSTGSNRVIGLRYLISRDKTAVTILATAAVDLSESKLLNFEAANSGTNKSRAERTRKGAAYGSLR